MTCITLHRVGMRDHGMTPWQSSRFSRIVLGGSSQIYGATVGASRNKSSVRLSIETPRWSSKTRTGGVSTTDLTLGNGNRHITLIRGDSAGPVADGHIRDPQKRKMCLRVSRTSGSDRLWRRLFAHRRQSRESPVRTATGLYTIHHGTRVTCGSVVCCLTGYRRGMTARELRRGGPSNSHQKHESH